MKTVYLLLSGLILLSGCTSTTITGAWKDPQYSGDKLQNVLVIGIVKNDLLKHFYEDTFVRELKAKEVAGTASYTIIPADKRDQTDFIRQQLSDRAFDYLLLTRITDKKTLKIIHPGSTEVYGRSYNSGRYYGPSPYYRNWNSYYDRGYSSIYTIPETTTEIPQVILETNVYSAASGEIIYSVQTDTLLVYGSEKNIREIVHAIIGHLSKNKLL